MTIEMTYHVILNGDDDPAANIFLAAPPLIIEGVVLEPIADGTDFSTFVVSVRESHC